MSKPIEMLKSEHRVIEGALRTLDGICVKLQGGIAVPPETLSQMLDFIRTYADRFHHGKEETHLFPALEQKGIPRHGGPIGVMLSEHETGRALVANLASAVEAYRQGDPSAVQRFVAAAWRYKDLLAMHICKEESVLFMIADDVLDAQVVASLSEAFEQENLTLGAGLHEEYERIAGELEKAWAA